MMGKANASRRKPCYWLLALALLLTGQLFGCEEPERVPDEPIVETIPETYTETFSPELPHLAVSGESVIPGGLTLVEHPEWVYEKQLDTDVFIMRTNLESGTTQINLDERFRDDFSGASCHFTIGCITPLHGASMHVSYTDTNGEQRSVSVELPYHTGMQKVHVRLDQLAVSADAPELTLSFRALDDGLYVRVAHMFLTQIDPDLPALGQTLLIEPKYDNSYYGSGAYITAVASVTQFGAVGDGKIDDTSAFEAALRYAQSLGGGTIYVPEGRYVLTRTMQMPDSVALVGEIDLTTLNATGQLRGSILQCYAGKGEADGTPMFTLNNYSTLQSLAFWYPEQTLTDGQAIPYPYTIAGRTSSTLYGSNLENLVLVNSYQGIRFGNAYNVLEVLRNVYGTPLHTGFMIGGNADIARVEGMCFSTYYWANSKLPGAPAESEILAVTQESGTGAIVERVDWTYMFDMAFDGYRTGMLFRHTSDGINEGSANGSLYRLDITNCRFGIEVQQSHEIGLMLTDSTIRVGGYTDAVALLLNSNESTAMNVIGCELQSEGKHVIYNAGNTALSVLDTDLRFVGDTAHGVAVHCAAGSLSMTACRFENANQALYLGKTVAKAVTLNCKDLTSATVKNESAAGIYTVQPDQALSIPALPEVDIHGNTAVYRPDSTALIDLSAAPYGVKNGDDITDVLQEAIDSLSGTGGTVYLPVGTYRVEDAIVVRSGVELRGALDASISRITNTTRLVTDFGRNDPDGEALITLESGAGLVGIRIGYDRQDATALVPYSYAVRGDGADIYVRNVSFDNVWNGLDLASHRCDRHLVKGLMGVAFSNAVRVGGGSTGGIVRDVLTNPAYWDINNTKDDISKQLTFIKLEDCTDEVLYANFHYAGAVGLYLGDGVKNAVVVTHGSDYGNRVIYAPTGDADVTLINTQMAPFAGGERVCVDAESDFDGSICMIGVSVWTSPQRIIRAASGEIGLWGGNLLAWGSPSVELRGDADVTICGVCYTGMSGSPQVRITGGDCSMKPYALLALSDLVQKQN